MTQQFKWPFFLFLSLSVGCSTPAVNTKKNPKCRAEIRLLQTKENAGIKVLPDEGLRMQELGAEIDKHMPSIRNCYDTSVSTRTVEDRREIRYGFLIRKDGSVTRTCVEETQLDDVELQGCLAQVLRSIRFPFPRAGASVAISFPFTFETHVR
jgi:hypothetical protein